ncbi:MAG: hypothetical protein ACLP53_17800, partial [Isosphaeraceae bacterium]
VKLSISGKPRGKMHWQLPERQNSLHVLTEDGSSLSDYLVGYFVFELPKRRIELTRLGELYAPDSSLGTGHDLPHV